MILVAIAAAVFIIIGVGVMVDAVRTPPAVAYGVMGFGVLVIGVCLAVPPVTLALDGGW